MPLTDCHASCIHCPSSLPPAAAFPIEAAAADGGLGKTASNGGNGNGACTASGPLDGLPGEVVSSLPMPFATGCGGSLIESRKCPSDIIFEESGAAKPALYPCV